MNEWETEDWEEYWHNKHPVQKQMYAGRPLPGTQQQRYAMDVRQFIWPDDHVLRGYCCNLFQDRPCTLDDIVWEVQKAAVKRLTYTRDASLGCPEYWMFPIETHYLERGDCEDGAIWMASVILTVMSPLDNWRIRCSAGKVKVGQGAETGGHMWLTYCRETDNQWVIVDWCYHEDSDVAVADKLLAKHNENYVETWFSFNNIYAWSHDNAIAMDRLRER